MKSVVLALGLVASAGSASAAEVRWDVVGEGAATVMQAYLAEDGEVLEGDDLALAYLSCPRPGTLRLWVHIENELVEGQATGPNGMREPLVAAATIALGSARFAFPDATLTPEELYGGNELVVETADLTGLVAAMGSSAALDVSVAGFATSIPLDGVADPLAKLVRACGA